ncbi:CHP725-containing protein [Calothrix sp. NIES-4071]|nr:CHP725-containing protein [Calothrix sp. NIES-4071]BAZ63840.1 CHP725-containing protein [Calothrix sp. NIES-4105]
MGPGEKATPTDIENAYQLGRRIAEQGWVLLTGGRSVGVMEAASQGAKANNGLTIGILPGNNDKGISEAVDIAIFTDMHNARNNINVLSSDIIIACGMGLGTASEVALALKSKKPVILLTDNESQTFFQKMAPVYLADNVDSVLIIIKNILETG